MTFEPEQIVNDHAKSPSTFSILDRLQNRGMPVEDVPIYLNEKLGWVLVRLEEKYSNTTNPKQIAQLEKDLADVRAALASEKYIVTIQGMTNERYDEIVEETLESFPYEYDVYTNPLTQQKVKTIVPNDDRDALFNTLFLAEAVTKITDPSGAVDENITPEVIVQFKRMAPIDAIREITTTAEGMRMVGAWMNEVETPDFTLKP